MTDPWFFFLCPMCRSRLRIKTEYTQMRGRCPACGMRLEPPNPKPLAVKPALHEPGGLLLEDEEWPESATVVEETASTETTYAVDEKGSLVPKPKEEQEIDTGGTYNLVFDPDAPKTPGVTRYADWNQPGATPQPPVPSPAPIEPFPIKNEPAPLSAAIEPTPAYETVVDPLFGDVVKIAKPSPSPVDNSSSPTQVKKLTGKVPPPPAPPVARQATPADLQNNQAAPSPRPDRAESAVPAKTEKPSPSNRTTKSLSNEKPSLVTTATDEPSEETHLYELNEAELNPRKADPPPKVLFFDGVFDFAWRKGNWKPWAWLSTGFTLLSLLLYLIFFLAAQGQAAAIVGAGAFGMAGFLIAVWTCSYASVCLLTAVSETATGNDRIEWPQESYRETFFPSLKVIYYYLIAALVTYPLAFVGAGNIGWQAITFLIFPAFLFSGLASANSWNFLHADVIQTILKKIYFYLIMYGLSLAIIGLGGTLFILSIHYPFLIPIAGIGFPACWLIYCRLLGRMAFTLNQDAPEKTAKKRKKKKKKAVVESAAVGHEGEEDSSTKVDQSVDNKSSADSKPAAPELTTSAPALSTEQSEDVYTIQK